jgi:exopolysaccharide biosynthesis polyprenyl glycosylphosphotransferase
MLKQQAKLVARMVYLADIVLTTVAFFAGFWIRDEFLPFLFPDRFPTGLYPVTEYLKIYPLVVVIWSFLLFRHRSYRSHRTTAIRAEALQTMEVVAVGTVIFATMAWLFRLTELSRTWFAIFFVLDTLLLVSVRLALRLVARWVRERGMNYRTIVIVGTGRRAREIVSLIEEHKYWGYRILGFISDGHRLPSELSRFPVLGDLARLRKLLEEGTGGPEMAIDEVIFAVTRRKLEASRGIFRLCEELGVRTRVAMSFFPTRNARVEFEELDGVPLISFTTTPSNVPQLAMKRSLDVAISVLLIGLSAPLVLLTAIAIKLSSPGAVFFKQERMGLNGRVFTLYKFRTMIDDAHRRRTEIEHLNEMDGPVFKVKADPRVTRIGRLLRKFSLDELPQLWNVLKGDMSLVGPRPPIPEEVILYERWQKRRLSMKPGLTCLWQISGRNEVDFNRWMELDLQYIDNWSPSLDFKIMLRTIPAVLSGRGAS